MGSLTGAFEMSENVTHVAHGKEYEIRVVPTETGVKIRAYLHGKRIGPTRIAPYEVVHQYDANPSRLTKFGAIAALVDCVKDDLNRGNS
jgi:hypothetical protein